MYKLVIDTNIALAGFLSYTKPERYLLNYAYQKKIAIVGTEETYTEFARKIRENEHFMQVAKAFLYSEEKLLHSYKSLIRLATINDELNGITYCQEDPDDDAFIRAAISTDCKIIISRDKHLRKLHNQIEQIRIVEPEVMIASLKKILD